uniref:Uncharacterized protein n=1 Tax=Strongyloides stercoralis TaxID=6248 RepID=A0A0K0EMT2_STRER
MEKFDLLESNKTSGYQKLFNFAKSKLINNLCIKFVDEFIFKNKMYINKISQLNENLKELLYAEVKKKLFSIS